MTDERSAPAAAEHLGRPLRELTRLGVDEWTLRRMWDGIQRRSALAGAAPVRRRSLLALRLGLALGMLLLAGGSWLVLREPGVRPRAAVSGPLLLAGGRHFDHLEAVAQGVTERAAFADGSSIEVAPGARVEGLAATASEFVVLVRQGKARFSVTPGGPRRWSIETPSARVEVVGTVLSVENGDGFVDVRVDEGVVLVRSALLPDGVRRIQAGESLRLEPPSKPVPEASAAPDVAEPELPQGFRPEDLPELPRTRADLRAGHAPRQRPGTSAAELWAGADRARQAGDSARAAQLLERLLYEHPGDSQAALGAYTLGRLQLERLGKPRAAAASFEQALELGLAEALRESCYVRWAEALRQSGDVRGLRDVVGEYASRYPRGAQRQALQRLLDQSGPARTKP